MSRNRLRERVAAIRAEACELGELLAAEAADMAAEELFEVVGDLQGVANSVEGAQLVATAHAASHETRLTERGPVEAHHAVGFVDPMASSEVSLATGIGQWAAGRRVMLAAAVAERFPRLLHEVIAGRVAAMTVAKVVSTCEGLDREACAAVEAVLVDRLAGLDPARVTTVTRRVATRVAADQVRAAQATNRRDRCVQVSPGPDGTTTWWAQLPAARSAAAWAAITTLGDAYAEKDPRLSVEQARGEAFLDLLLTNVTVSARVTVGIPVITGEEGQAASRAAAEVISTESAGGSATNSALPTEAHVTTDTAVLADDLGGLPPAPAVGGSGLGADFSISAALSGCEMPGIGFIDADTVEALLMSVPLDVGRALLDARTGTLLETTSSAYRPPRGVTDFVTTRDGTCRMWGCPRPAAACDVDHARPWPAGATTPGNLAGLCRRHHRLKQRRRWTYELDRDGTATWVSPSGRKRVSLPDHAIWPPPEPQSHRVTGPVAQTPSRPDAVEPPPF
jgi:hypothetical protein